MQGVRVMIEWMFFSAVIIGQANHYCDGFLTKLASRRTLTSPHRQDTSIHYELREGVTNSAIIETLFSSSPSSSLIELDLLGTGYVGSKNQRVNQTSCIFLSYPTLCDALSKETKRTPEEAQIPQRMLALPIPLPDNGSEKILKLLSFAYKSEPISKSLCLTLNPLLINRDGTLYDNIPWATWSIDPSYKNRDAAGNPIEEKYHLGKRDAYNRFMGRDWFGRSLSIGNLAARVKYMLGNTLENKGAEDASDSLFNEESSSILAQRVLELELKESRMAIAEAEEQLAIFKASLQLNPSQELLNDEKLEEKIHSLEEAKAYTAQIEEAIEELAMPKIQEKNESFVTKLLSAIIKGQENDAPYRGALGFRPTIDSEEEMLEKSILPYSSPYELMCEIIMEQLNAQVIGCIIENTSLFPGSLVLGGAVVLKRKGRKKIVDIDGEKLEMVDSDDDFGSKGVKAGEIFIVECDPDETIGMALTLGLSIQMERSIWEATQAEVCLSDGEPSFKVFPFLENTNKSMQVNVQGDGIPSIDTPIQIPRTSSAFDSFFNSNNNGPVYSTDNPIKSINEYDQLNTQDKAQILLSLESFKSKLPRPRILEQNKDKEGIMNPIDKLLVPLIDESVRRELLIRDAENKGDFESATALRKNKSRKQIADEKAAEAIRDDNLIEFEKWNSEAEFYANLRADVTQDEGSYSSFLDKDDWYERDRKATAKRVNKKKFGTLLDGIE